MARHGGPGGQASEGPSGLAADWLLLIDRLGLVDSGARFDRGQAGEVGARLLAAYGERRRAYHDTTHLGEVLGHIATLEERAAQPDVVRMAGWWHDAVYEPARTDNEERSATLAAQALLGLGLGAPVVEEVARLVRLTATHEVRAGDADGAVLCDADLAILAATPDRYAAYARGVREEYAAFDDRSFTAGRTRVLRALLERPSLYATPYARARWEAGARRNVAAELAALAPVGRSARTS